MAIDTLEVMLTLDATPFQRAAAAVTRTVDRSTKKWKDRFSKVRAGVNKFGDSLKGLVGRMGPLVAAMGAAVGVAATFAKIMEAFQRNDSLGKTADRLGLTTERLAGLHVAADRSGVAIEGMNMALQRMNRRIADAVNGAGPAAKILTELGLSAEELLKRSPDEAFAMIAEEINGLGNQAEKTRAAFALFDVEGGKLLKTMEGGAEGIRQARKEAERLGVAVSRFDAFKAEEVNDAFARMQDSMKGVFNALSSQLAPVLILAADLVTELAVRFRNMDSSSDIMVKTLVTGLKAIATVVHGLMIIWDSWKAGILLIAKTFTTMASAVIKNIATIGVRIKGMIDLMASAMDSPQAAWDLAWAGMKRLVANAVADMIDTIAEVGLAFGDLASIADKDLGNSIKMTFNDAVISASSFATKANFAFDKVQKKTAEVFPEMADAARRAFGTLGEGDFPEFVNNITSGLDEAGTVLDERFKAAFESVKETALMFGGETAWSWIDGMQMSLEERWADIQAKFQENLSGMNDKVKGQMGDAGKVAGNTWAEWMKLSMESKLGTISGILGNLATLMDSKSRTLFKIGKAAAISQAVVDTYASANKAMTTLPWPLNLAAAAATTAAGLLNVQKISSRQFGTDGSAAGGGSAGGAEAGAGAAGGAEAGGTTPQAVTPTTTFNIGLQGDRFSGNQVRGLLDAMNDQLDDNAQINVRQTT